MYEESHHTLPDPDRRYWRRRANRTVRKARRTRTLMKWTGIVAVNLFILAALAYSGNRTFRHLTTSPEFSLRSVAVEGTSRSTPEGIRERLADLEGTNLWELDLQDVAARVRRDPWVLDCAVKRVLPQTLRVVVTEREPAALARLRGGDYVVDRHGVVVGPSEGSGGRLPALVGLDGLGERARDDALRRGVAAVMRLGEVAGAWTAGLRELDLSREDRIVVVTRAPGPRIVLDPASVDRNVADYLAMKQDIDQRVGRMEYVDLRWRDRIAVMPEPNKVESR